VAGQTLPAGFIPDVAPPGAVQGAKPAGFIPDGFIADPAPDFRSSNDPAQATALAAKQRADDAAAEAAKRPSWLQLAGEAVKGWGAGMNPLPLLKAMYDDVSGQFSQAIQDAKDGNFGKMAGSAAGVVGSPSHVLLESVIGSHWQQFVKAKKAYDAGRYSEAAGYTTAGMVPLLGPLAAHAGEEIGTGDPRTMARGVGTAAAALAPESGLRIAGKALGAVSDVGRSIAGGGRLNPLEEASNAFAREHDIPLDAATATGSKVARAVQKRVANSMGGEGAAADMITAQREALARTGDKLANEANGVETVTPEWTKWNDLRSRRASMMAKQNPGMSAGKLNADAMEFAGPEPEKFTTEGPSVKAIDAGEGVRGTIRTLITNLHDMATKAYGELRKAEASSANADTVPIEPAPVDAVPDWQKRQLRRIVHEMDASGYTAGHLQDAEAGDLGVGSSGKIYNPRTGGAAVFHDIQDHGGAGLDRGELQHEIEVYLGGGAETAGVKGALEVARRRYVGDAKLSAPELPSSAFDVPTKYEGARELSRQMAMAVDLTDVKAALRPIRDRMAAGADIAPLMGPKADAFRALTRIIDGPNHAPLSVVDEALGDLKALARGGKNGPALPELRTAGAGTAAYAVSRLDAMVRARAAQAGPGVLAALEEGRAATREKVAAGDLFETLREEPVQAFEQLTAPGDKGINLLRSIRDVAPTQMMDVARAWLEKQLDLAQQEGGFGHADKMWANWQAMGKQTKQILFSAPGQTQALDRFFLLAKRMAENPNPSGTAHTLTALNVGSVPVMAGLAKMLYTKRGVDALTTWLSAGQATRGASAGAGAGSAARAAAWLGVRAAAQRAGWSLPAQAPLAADADEGR
jgi:hypothetical protein